MSLKFILGLLLFVILSTYLSFLNPREVEFYLTNSLSFKLPLAVFLLGSVLIGVFFTGIFTGIRQAGDVLKHFQESRARKKQEKLINRREKLFQKAKNAFVSGRQPKAVALFEKILAESPEHAQSLYHLGIYMKKEGKYDDAIELHKKALRLEPENIQLLYRLSEDYASAGMNDNELKTLEKILQLDRNSLPTLRRMRDACLKTKDWDKAYIAQKSILPLIHDSGELAVEQERFSQIVYSNGKHLYKSGDADSAIAEFKRSIRENSKSLPAYITLGDIYLEAKNPKAALKIWKAGFSATRSPICLLRMQKIYQASERVEEIAKLYKGAMRSSQNSEMEQLGLMFGTFLLRQGNLDDAVQVLESVQKSSLPLSLLTVKAYREKHEPGQVETLTRAACDEVVKSLDRYTCAQCRTAAEEWTGNCPSCLSWDSLKIGPTLPN